MIRWECLLLCRRLPLGRLVRPPARHRKSSARGASGDISASCCSARLLIGNLRYLPPGLYLQLLLYYRTADRRRPRRGYSLRAGTLRPRSRALAMEWPRKERKLRHRGLEALGPRVIHQTSCRLRAWHCPRRVPGCWYFFNCLQNLLLAPRARNMPQPIHAAGAALTRLFFF